MSSTPGGRAARSRARGPCSLRDAVLFANTKATADVTTITLPAGTYTLRITGTAENAALTGGLDLTRTVVINGAGASATGSAAGGIDRVLQVGTDASGPVAATISGVTIRYGGNTAGGNGTGILVYTSGSLLTLNDSSVADNAASSGGGVYVVAGATLVANRTTILRNTSGGGGGGSGIVIEGTVTLNDSAVADNTAAASGGGIVVASGATLTANRTAIRDNTSGSNGGGIYNTGGTVTVTDSTLAGNTAHGYSSGSGGGIFNNNGMVTVTNSTVSGNTAHDDRGFSGGARGGGTLAVTNSTFSGNHADNGGGSGGGIHNGGTATVMNSTLVGNTTDGSGGYGGGGIHNEGTLTAVNTLIAGNTALGRGPDVLGTLAAGSKNDLLGNGSFATGVADNDANGNIVGHPALVDTTLRDNGATNGTQTLARLPGSPAIDRGNDATCMNAAGSPRWRAATSGVCRVRRGRAATSVPSSTPPPRRCSPRRAIRPQSGRRSPSLRRCGAAAPRRAASPSGTARPPSARSRSAAAWRASRPAHWRRVSTRSRRSTAVTRPSRRVRRRSPWRWGRSPWSRCRCHGRGVAAWEECQSHRPRRVSRHLRRVARCRNPSRCDARVALIPLC